MFLSRCRAVYIVTTVGVGLNYFTRQFSAVELGPYSSMLLDTYRRQLGRKRRDDLTEAEEGASTDIDEHRPFSSLHFYVMSFLLTLRYTLFEKERCHTYYTVDIINV